MLAQHYVTLQLYIKYSLLSIEQLCWWLLFINCVTILVNNGKVIVLKIHGRVRPDLRGGVCVVQQFYNLNHNKFTCLA